MLIRVLLCGLMGGARLIELAFSRRNVRESGAAVEGDWSRRTFPLIFAVHTTVILGTLLRGDGKLRLAFLLPLLAVQPLRAWVLLSLGRRWNARGAVDPGMDVETRGPYALVRHPNYAVVAVELATLPACFGLKGLALAASLANAALLTIRIREEEALLFQLPAYREHFGAKPRFLPFLV